MKVLITGATGMIGSELVKLCHANNIDVHYLTTSKSKLNNTSNYKGFYWNPLKNEIDTSCFNGVEIIINLVGASVSKRWTKAYKTEIIESRTKTANLLKTTIEQNKFPIKQIISASGIAMYPTSLVNYYDEESTEISYSFLGEVVKKWEADIDSFSELNIKTCKFRIGLVLSNKGGALPKIVHPIKFGFGAAFGSGNQWQSWIHISDLVALFLFAIKNELTGVYNAVAPNPVTNTEFVKTAARVLKRPLILPNIPKVIMKMSLGEMHKLLFDSQRVSSKKIENLDFVFTFHHLKPALQDLLG